MVSRLSFINTDSALMEASRFANQFITPERTSNQISSGTAIRHVHEHYNCGFPGYYSHPVYVCGSEDEARSSKKGHAWIAIPAAIIGLGTMYFIGQNHADWSQAKENLAKLQQRNRIVRIELSHAPAVLKSSVQAVFEKQAGILQRIRSDAITGLALKVMLAASAALAGIGALASGGILFAAALEPLFGYGMFSAFITSSAMLYRAGFNDKNGAIQSEARELHSAIHRAAGVLNEVAKGS